MVEVRIYADFVLAVTMFRISFLFRSLECNIVKTHCVFSVLSDTGRASWTLPSLKLHNSTVGYYFIHQSQRKKPREAQRRNFPPANPRARIWS